jgi:hypothetical protein
MSYPSDHGRLLVFVAAARLRSAGRWHCYPAGRLRGPTSRPDATSARHAAEVIDPETHPERDRQAVRLPPVAGDRMDESCL